MDRRAWRRAVDKAAGMLAEGKSDQATLAALVRSGLTHNEAEEAYAEARVALAQDSRTERYLGQWD